MWALSSLAGYVQVAKRTAGVMRTSFYLTVTVPFDDVNDLKPPQMALNLTCLQSLHGHLHQCEHLQDESCKQVVRRASGAVVSCTF